MSSFETTADMLQEGFCQIRMLEEKLNVVVTQIFQSLKREPILFNLFLKEHIHWRKWVHLTVGLERELTEGTIAPLIAQGLRIQLLEERITSLKEIPSPFSWS